MTTRVINGITAQLSFLVGLDDKLVSITRPSKWGNPFSHHRRPSCARYLVASREEAIAKHEEWLIAQPELMRALPELRGKVLSCVCLPQTCHGTTLARYADTYPLIKRPNGIELHFDNGYAVRPTR